MDRQAHERDLELIRATVATAHAALKAAMLINAGAAIAMLAFLGNIVQNKVAANLIPSLSCALILYVWGVLVAAVATGTAYVSQAGFGNELGKRSKAIGGIFRMTSGFLIATSYVLFGYASWGGYTALLRAG